jgi:hypothetical protein
VGRTALFSTKNHVYNLLAMMTAFHSEEKNMCMILFFAGRKHTAEDKKYKMCT